MLELNNVTLFGLDTVNYEGLMHAAEESQRAVTFNDVVLLSGRDAVIERGEDYSKWILTELPGVIKTDYVLIIQADGYILNPDAWDEEFLMYDYIGAPWPYQDRDVGNGGFSLRTKKFIDIAKYVYETTEQPNYHPEDNFTCRLKHDEMMELGVIFAPSTLAKNFSMESNPKYGSVWNGQFGFHNDRITDISKHDEFK